METARTLTRLQVFNLSPYSTVSGSRINKSGSVSQCCTMWCKYVCPSLPTLGKAWEQPMTAVWARGF